LGGLDKVRRAVLQRVLKGLKNIPSFGKDTVSESKKKNDNTKQNKNL
jgi:hypothetical protein